jgi:hypothetical protein
MATEVRINSYFRGGSEWDKAQGGEFVSTDNDLFPDLSGAHTDVLTWQKFLRLYT